MNKLSWLLYAADVLGHVKVVLVIAASLIGIALAIWWFAVFCNRDEGNDDFPMPRKYMYSSLLGILLLSCLFPSQTTIYLIAGSEAGEVAVKSEIGQRVLQAVEKAIERQAQEKN